nr:unnamed protein product [Callosobruchus analis]
MVNASCFVLVCPFTNIEKISKFLWTEFYEVIKFIYYISLFILFSHGSFHCGTFSEQLKLFKSIPVFKNKGSREDVETHGSFLCGRFPEQLKLSKSIPVFKNKGSRENVEKYSNISISQFVKLFECAFSVGLTYFLEINKLLISSQHGFRGKGSTTSALKDLAEFFYSCLHNKELPSIILFDLSRAFDTVDHQLLLVKLNHMGIRGISNKWNESYLQGRQQ